MNANQLRASILQMAIEGKLVPQLDSEPAVEQLGNAPEDVPFEIPEKWKWVGFDHLLNIISGTSYKKHCITNSINDIRIIRGGNLRNNTISLLSDDIFVSQDLFDETKIVKNTDIVIVASTGSSTVIGRTAIYQGDELFQIGAFLRILRPKNTEYFDYLKFVFFSNYFSEYIRKKAQGTSINNLQKGYFTSFLIPLPPLEEQKRIVAKLEQLLPLVDEYGKAYEKLEELNAEFPDKLKASVLQRAIEGKLVPQLDSEPVASEYLKGLNPKVKFVDESETNYSIPDKWRIVKLSSICTKIVDGDHNPPKGELEPTKYLMLSAKNINNNSLIINDAVRFLSKENFETSHSRTQLAKDDVLLTIVGTLGRSCVVEDVSENITFQRSVACLSTLIYSKYLKYFLDAPDVQKYITINAKGTAQKGFYLNQLKNLHIAIPPLEEQKRIVAKVEELFALIDAMKK